MKAALLAKFQRVQCRIMVGALYFALSIFEQRWLMDTIAACLLIHPTLLSGPKVQFVLPDMKYKLVPLENGMNGLMSSPKV
jgi:hypothetical protein